MNDMVLWAAAAMVWGFLAVLIRWRRSGLTLMEFAILFATRIVSQLVHRWRSKGFTHLPPAGPALVISNHTCSADPIFLLGGSPRMLSFLVAREHYDIHWFTTLLLNSMRCVKVTRNGRDSNSLRQGLRRLADGCVFTLFPEGGLSGIAKNRLLPGKPGIAWLALVSRVPVYPVFIAGGPRTEKLLYSWIVPAPTPVHVIFGKAIDLSAYYDRPRTRQVLEEVTAYLMRHIADLDPNKKKGRLASVEA